MKYGFMPKLMWTVYKGTFKKQLSETLREENPGEVMKLAHKKYKEILADVDEFEKGDRFLINFAVGKKQIYGRRSPRVLP